MNWETIVSRVAPSVVRIDTPEGTGTGFVCLNDKHGQRIGIATAAHVVRRAQQWVQPIRIWSETAKAAPLIYPADRTILLAAEIDAAVLLVPPFLDLPADRLVPLVKPDERIPIGAHVGWIGFPIDTTPCFFTGVLSAVEMTPTKRYLLDGVSIDGVSGGPVFHFDRATNTPHIFGIITSNQQYRESIPFLSAACDVSHCHSVSSKIRDMELAVSDRTMSDFQRMTDELRDTS